MRMTKKLYAVTAVVVLFFGASATFGYSVLIHKNTKNTASKSEAAAVIPTIPTTNYPIPTGAIYMSPTGNDANAGTASAPVKTMNKAQSIAPSGGTIVLRAGVYRDGLAGVSKALTWQAYPNEQVWLDGTDVVSGWQSAGNGTWYVDGWYTPEFCGGQYYSYPYDAQKADNTGPCNHKDMTLDPSNPIAGSPQMAFVNGTQLKEVTSVTSVTAGTFFYDKTSRRFTIGTDPTNATVELARRANAIIPTATTAIKGIGFRHYATNEYNNNTEAPVVVSAANSVIENSVFWQNAGYGLGVSNAQSVAVRSSQFLANGFDGMTANGHHAGSATVDNIIVDGNVFDGNNAEKFGTGCSLSCAQAGVKFAHMNGGTIKNNKFTNNIGHGFWCDLYCTNFTIAGNYVAGNTKSGIFYEVSNNAIIASNLVINGEYGIRIAGPNVKLYNNTVVNPGRMSLWVYDDPRTPSGSEIPADTANVEVGNNIMQGGTDFLQWLEGQQTTWSQLESYSDYNSFWRPTSTPTVGFKYGTNNVDSYANTVAIYHTATGKETNSQDIVNNTNPYFMNAAAGDYRIRTDSTAYNTGKPLASDVAAAIGVTAGQPINRGAVVWVGMPTTTTSTADKTAPTAPSALTITGSAYNSVGLSWTASTDNVGVTGYQVFRNGGMIATISGAVTKYTDGTVAASTAYSYQVRAVDAANNPSALSNTVSPTTPASPDTSAPTAPTNLAIASSAYNSVSLTWTASTDNVGVTGYQVFRNGGMIATISGAVKYTDSSVAANTLYDYQVRAVDAANNPSALSNDVQLTTPQPPDATAPSTPASLVAQAPAYNKITLSWTASTDNVGVTGYYLVRNGVTISNNPTTTYTDNAVSANTSYSYQVMAHDAAGNVSQASNTATVTTPNPPDTIAPSVPGAVTATTVNTTQINVSWAASTDNVGVTSYKVNRNGTLVATISASAALNYGDSGLAAGTAYSYTVIACDAANNCSAPSAAASATTASQQLLSSISGTVKNTSGSPIAKARVTASNGINSYTAYSNAQGSYVLPNLSASTYSARYSAKKFLVTNNTIVVGSGVNVINNVTLTSR